MPRSFRLPCPGDRAQRRASRADDLVRHSPLFYAPAVAACAADAADAGGSAVAGEGGAGVAGLGWPAAGYWLIWAQNVQTGEEKYFVSNAPARTPLRRLVRVAFCRWNVEHGFRVSKSEIGFRHFEGRSYVGLMRHLTLCLVTLTFVAGQTDQLRGEKSRGDPGAGVPGPELGVPGLAGPVAGDARAAAYVRGHLLSPAA